VLAKKAAEAFAPTELLASATATGPYVNFKLDRGALFRRVFQSALVDKQLLPTAYGAADVFAYPSHAEGFGLPALEAMACGTAVLTSSTTSLPEVVGDAALMVDPLDQDAIARGLERLLSDASERRALAEAGIARAATFSWDRVAEQTMAVYAEAAA